MAVLSSNDCREFRVARTPELESRGYPCLFSVTLDGHTIQKVTKSGLKAMKAEINQALCDKPADVNSHNTHPNRKEENQCSGSLSQ